MLKNKQVKITNLLIIDFIAYLIIPVIALFIRLGDIPLEITETSPIVYLLLPMVLIPLLYYFGIYHFLINHIGFTFLKKSSIAISVGLLAWSTIIFLTDIDYPRGAYIISWMACILYLIGSRGILRQWAIFKNNDSIRDITKVLVYGAGDAGTQIAKALENSPKYSLVAIIDDNPATHKIQIGSVTVLPAIKLKNIVAKHDIDEVIIAVPSMSRHKRAQLIAEIEQLAVRVRFLPGLDQILKGEVSLTDIREVEITDLLEREIIKPDETLLKKCIRGKTVLVTGGGGSIGSELCRQIIFLRPKILIIYDNSEYSLYEIDQEIQELNKNLPNTVSIISMIGSVTNKLRLESLFQKYKVDTIYHAAAYKHVPLVEHNIFEGIYNNTHGTKILASFAQKYKVQHFVLVSTDKAVRPTNIMGASKRLAEMVIQTEQLQKDNQTIFSTVRFGNVMDSSGSVIPLFRKQIKEGGPITVTHREVTRFFMTIPEAVSLIIQAGSMAEGGDVFVLDMGESIKIDTIAQKMIKLSGLQPFDSITGKGDVEIQYTGLRPGEKLFEELMLAENINGTEHPKISKAFENNPTTEKLEQSLIDLKKQLQQHDYQAVVDHLKSIVEGFTHEENIVDWLKSEEISR